MQIKLEPHNPNWKLIAQNEIVLIGNNSDFILKIEHYGSTSIKDLPAKPIIDLIAEVSCTLQESISDFEKKGYVLQANQPKDHLYFLKKNEHLFQLRVFNEGSQKFKERLIFRNNLNNDENLRREYLKLKESLSKQHPNDLSAYTDAKSEFVKRHSKKLIAS